MKFDRHKAFPYPVLRPYNDDFIDLEFQINAEWEVEGETAKVKIDYAISSEDIKQTIEHGNAVYISVISCRDTYTRNNVESNTPYSEAIFSVNDLRGEVRIDSYVVVVNDVPFFQSPDLNPEFGLDPVKYGVGDVMAQDETYVYYFNKEHFKPVESVFDLVIKASQPKGQWTIGFEGDHIQIEVNPLMKASIDSARNSKKNRYILLNSIYSVAVTQAIQLLKENPDDFSENTWAKVIFNQVNTHNCNLENDPAYLVAQKLLRFPLLLLENFIFKGGDQ